MRSSRENSSLHFQPRYSLQSSKIFSNSVAHVGKKNLMLPSHREVTEYENVTLKQKDLVTALKLFKKSYGQRHRDERESLKRHVIKEKVE